MIKKLISLLKRPHYIYATEEEIQAINKAITRQLSGTRPQKIQDTQMAGGEARDTESTSMY